MNQKKPPSEPELPRRPLEPPQSGDAVLLKWMLALLATAVAAAAWLAVRAESTPEVRQVLDTSLEFGTGALVAFGAYRLLVLYPFRILDLLTIVLMLSFGLKVTLQALASSAEYGFVELGPLGAREHLGVLALACLLTSSVLLAGAALGLRYCVRLRLDGAWERVAALAYGMLSFPAAVGFFAFPGLILMDFLEPGGPRDRSLLWLLMWLLASFVVARSTLLLIRSMALSAEVGQKREPLGK